MFPRVVVAAFLTLVLVAIGQNTHAQFNGCSYGFCSKGGGSAAAPTWTPTDAQIDDSVGFVTTKTFASVNIGTPSATRVVVVGASGFLGGNSGSYSSIAVNGVSLTFAKSSGNTGTPSELWYGNVPTGTTVSVVVTSSAAMQQCGISVGALDHVTAAPTSTALLNATGGQNSPYTMGAGMTVPSTGFGLVHVYAGSAATVTWSNMTDDNQISGASSTSDGAHTAVAGAIAPSFTALNMITVQMVGATWGP